MDDIDWRLKASARVSKDTRLSGGQIAKKGELLKVVTEIQLSKKQKLTIPLPDVVALYISKSKKAWDEYYALKSESKVGKTKMSDIVFLSDDRAFDATESIAASTILAYSAIESFCNDSIPEDHEYWHQKKSELILEKSSKEDIERYFSTTNKLNEVLPSIYSVGSPKGKSPIWDSYLTLKKCRDGLVHAKTREVRPRFDAKRNIWAELYKLRAPYLLARNVFDWYLSKSENKPYWYENYPK